MPIVDPRSERAGGSRGGLSGLAFVAAVVVWVAVGAAGPELTGSAGTALPLELPAGYEPSGAVWLSSSNTLILVHDEGTVSAFDPISGTGRHWQVGGDLEAVTADPDDESYVYLGVERPPAIWKFDRTAGKVVARCGLNPLAKPAGEANAGIEGLAFVPASTSAAATFWVGWQSDGSIDRVRVRWTPDGLCALDPVDRIVPVASRKDLSDLAWDPWNRRVLALYDRANVVRVLDASGGVVAQWPVDGDSQEGLAVQRCAVLVADDASGRVTRYPVSDVGGCPSPE